MSWRALPDPRTTLKRSTEMITEAIFSLPGLGALAISSVVDADLPLIVGITLVTATFIIVANLIVDLLYAVIDPRVRLV